MDYDYTKVAHAICSQFAKAFRIKRDDYYDAAITELSAILREAFPEPPQGQGIDCADECVRPSEEAKDDIACPFCGLDDALKVFPDYSEDEPDHIIAYHVKCRHCGARGRNNYPIGWCESEEAAWEAWLHRGSVRPGQPNKAAAPLQEARDREEFDYKVIDRLYKIFMAGWQEMTAPGSSDSYHARFCDGAALAADKP